LARFIRLLIEHELSIVAAFQYDSRSRNEKSIIQHAKQGTHYNQFKAHKSLSRVHASFDLFIRFVTGE